VEHGFDFVHHNFGEPIMAAGHPDREAVMSALKTIKDPETGRDVVSLEQVRDVQLADGRLSLTLALTSHSAPVWEETRQAVTALLAERFPELKETHVELAVHERPAEKIGQIGLTVKSAIAIGSGKGGVGKSTIAACLALGLKRAGAKVGLVDADVYGPSIPHLMGVDQRPTMVGQRILPIEKDGLRLLSMGLLVPQDEAVIWRGPMLHSAISQFLRDTEWGDLDYLVIDMPPGTGDVALTLSQLMPLTGAVVVCTPQDVALLDAVKAIAMFRKVNIPVLGIVENMSGFICPDCGKQYDIFGRGGAQQKAAELQVPFLGEVPINIQIRARGDDGLTDKVFDDAATAVPFEAICRQLVRHLAASAETSPPLPSLTVLD
jgi:ATP-binding protein involved in chromosome partitioning